MNRDEPFGVNLLVVSGNGVLVGPAMARCRAYVLYLPYRTCHDSRQPDCCNTELIHLRRADAIHVYSAS